MPDRSPPGDRVSICTESAARRDTGGAADAPARCAPVYRSRRSNPGANDRSTDQPLMRVPDWATRRNSRLVSGLVLFTYITTHLANHAIGLVSLEHAEAALRVAVLVWHSRLRDAHPLRERRGASRARIRCDLPAAHLAHAAARGGTDRDGRRDAAASDRARHRHARRIRSARAGTDLRRIVRSLWESDSQGRQIALLAPGWIHGCLGLHFVLSRRPVVSTLEAGVLFGRALAPGPLRCRDLSPCCARSRRPARGSRSTLRKPTVASPLRPTPHRYPRRSAIPRSWSYVSALWHWCSRPATGARSSSGCAARPSRFATQRAPSGCRADGRCSKRAGALGHFATSMCGGRARCSTCRVRVIAGATHCPPIGFGGAQHARSHRRAARRAARLPTATTRRHHGHAAGRSD